MDCTDVDLDEPVILPSEHSGMTLINSRDRSGMDGLKSKMVISSSQENYVKKLENADFSPSGESCLMPGDVMIEKQIAKEQDLRQMPGKLHKDMNSSSETTMMETGLQMPSDTSRPDSFDMSSFQQLSLSSSSSGPHPASDIHSSPETDSNRLPPIIKPEDYPPKFKQSQYDCLLIHSQSEVDRRMAITFKKIIEKHLVLDDGRPPRVWMFDGSGDLENIQSRFDKLGEAMDRSTSMFLLMSKDFINDSWTAMQKDECLMVSLSEPERRWCVVPLHTKNKRELNFKYPFGLRSLKGLDVWNIVNGKNLGDVDADKIEASDLNERLIKNFSSLFNQRLCHKLERERKQQQELDKWILLEQYKRMEETNRSQLEQSLFDPEHKEEASNEKIKQITQKLYQAGLSVHDVMSTLGSKGLFLLLFWVVGVGVVIAWHRLFQCSRYVGLIQMMKQSD